MSAESQALLKAIAQALGGEGPAEVADAPRTRDLFAGGPVVSVPQVRTVLLPDGTTVTGQVVAKPRVECPNGCGRTFGAESGGAERHSLPSIVGDPTSKPSRITCTPETAAIYRNAAK